MSYQITSQPATEPITTAEAKSHLRVTFSDDDTYIDTLISAARKICEQYTNRAFITQTWRQNEDSFNTWNTRLNTSRIYGARIDLKINPVVSVTSVKYYDSSNVQQTLASANYQLDNLGDTAALFEGLTAGFPSISSAKVNPIEIIFVAGYGAAGDVPSDIKHAIKLMISHFYENREGVNVGVALVQQIEMPKVVKALLTPYRINVFG
ncbi:MAG: head-tail connector protein [Candidatus Roizmanbacteria bacterium]|nr:head-tail connector protein [Candidatus Roizmanbacteria bacterium]